MVPTPTGDTYYCPPTEKKVPSKYQKFLEKYLSFSLTATVSPELVSQFFPRPGPPESGELLFVIFFG